jgi:hypothetical protein
VLATRRLAPLAAALIALALTSSGALSPCHARADVVEAPPPDCPRGLRGESSHGGPYCMLDLCAAGGVCTDGRSCVRRSYCIVRRTGVSIGGPFVEDTATMRCTDDADCGGTGDCIEAPVCVDVEGHRIRGLVLFSIGLAMLAVLAGVTVMTVRSRRRRR